MTNETNHSSHRHLSLVLRLFIAILACWFLYKQIDPDKVVEAFARLRISTLLLAILCFCVGLCLIAFRWWVFMRAQQIYVPLFLAIKLTFLGQFFTNFMPSAVGGDLIRAWYISHHTPYRLRAAIGVAADRVMGLSGTIILAFTSYMLFMRGQNGFFQIDKTESPVATFLLEHPTFVPWAVFSGLVLIVVIILIIKIFDLSRFVKKIQDMVVHLFRQTYEVFVIYVRHPLILIFGLTISLFMQILVIFSFWLIGRDLGIEAQIHHYFVFFPIMWIIGSLPLSIAGIGILEGGLVVLFFQFTGTSKDLVAALALCQRFAWIISSLPGMIVHLSGAHRKKEDPC